MYPEFVAIYIMLALLVMTNAATLILLFLVLKKCNSGTADNAACRQSADPYYGQSYAQSYGQPYAQQNGSVVFCQQCATQYDVRQGYCPNCGARR
jgi:hypothetical protein